LRQNNAALTKVQVDCSNKSVEKYEMRELVKSLQNFQTHVRGRKLLWEWIQLLAIDHWQWLLPKLLWVIKPIIKETLTASSKIS